MYNPNTYIRIDWSIDELGYLIMLNPDFLDKSKPKNCEQVNYKAEKPQEIWLWVESEDLLN